jgi:hypothetical protein
MTTKKERIAAVLAEPVVIDKFWKNRSGEAVCVTFSMYEGSAIVDLRHHFTASDGRVQPTRKGLALSILRLPELAAAVNRALGAARVLGLIDDEGANA